MVVKDIGSQTRGARYLNSVGMPEPEAGNRDFLQGARARAGKRNYREPRPLNLFSFIKKFIKMDTRSREPGLFLEGAGAEIQGR